MKKEKVSLASYMAGVVSQLESEGRMGTAHVYRGTLRRVLDFLDGRSCFLDELTPLWLKSFQEYLLGRQLQWNSVSTYMRMLRAVYFRAVDAGKAVYVPRLFKGVYTGTRTTVKRALDEKTFRALSVPCPQGGVEVERARQLFLLMFMLRGIPFVDIAFLRRCDFQDNQIVYRRRKTGAWLMVRVEPQAMQLIEKLRSLDVSSPYLFPFVNSFEITTAYRQYRNALRRFNGCLKRLAVLKRMGGTLSSYCARHSWATIANYRDYRPELISNAMGHSSVKVTETYFKRHTAERIGQMNSEILSYVFCPG